MYGRSVDGATLRWRTLRRRTSNCGDLERGRRWYSEKLGLEPVSTSAFGSVIGFLRSNGVVFEHVDFGEVGATIDGAITTPEGPTASPVPRTSLRCGG